MGVKIQILNAPVKLFHKSAKVSIDKNASEKRLKDKRFHVHHISKAVNEFKPDLLNREVYKRRKRVSVDSYRMNELNVQMIPKSLHEQIFKHSCGERNEETKLLLEKAKKDLEKFGLLNKEVEPLKNVSLCLPKLKGENIEEHFWNIGLEQCEPYKKLLHDFISSGIPQMPKNWIFQEGWTKYKAGEKPMSVACPDEDALVMDVEVAVTVGQAPTLATAVSSEAWYGWVSQGLIENKNPVEVHHYSTDVLIPVTDKMKNCDNPRIIVGHYVSYDRARIKEEYLMKSNGIRFLDTASLHISVGGKSSAQKSKEKIDKSNNDKDTLLRTNLYSLKDLYKFYCSKTLSKEERNIFITGSLDDIRTEFQTLMSYCAKDVKATFEIVTVLFPTFLERFPHPVTLAGMLEMGTAYLPVSSNFMKYVQCCKDKYEDFSNEICSLLARKCDDACRLMHNEQYKDDLWMWNEDWSTIRLKLNRKTSKKLEKHPITEEIMNEDDEELKELMKRFCHLFDMHSLLPKTKTLLPGYPAWYKKLCQKPDSPDWTPGPHSLHTSVLISPKVLNLSYENYPLHFEKGLGWGILVADVHAKEPNTSFPYKKLRELTLKNLKAQCDESDAEDESKRKSKKEALGWVNEYTGTAVWCGHKIENCADFFRLPHKDGDRLNVGQPLSKSFCSTENFLRLSVPKNVSETGLKLTNKMSYWRNNRDRIFDQMIVWLKPEECMNFESPVGVILPKITVCGTLTRRAVEQLWLTIPSKPGEMLGSELRALVEAPPGYHFVGADVDSEELWIASILGDSRSLKIHGCTPFGWMTISGSKENGTDLHSTTAEAVGITRQQAKIINYARLYGAKPVLAMKLLRNYDSSVSNEKLKETITKMYEMTKGTRVFRMKDKFLMQAGHTLGGKKCVTSIYEAFNLAKKYKMKVEEIFEDVKWEGGIESDFYNELERIAQSRRPETPFLKCRLTRALEPNFDGDGSNLSTRANWVVQSGAVDFLHLIIVCMKWLTNGKVRYCLSVHDEVRYMVRTEDRYKAALALQIAHLLTRSFFSQRLGMSDLPMSVAFFSSVEIDKVLRKDCEDDCVTPSNPHGLEKGYGIGKGEARCIHKILEILQNDRKANASSFKGKA